MLDTHNLPTLVGFRSKSVMKAVSFRLILKLCIHIILKILDKSENAHHFWKCVWSKNFLVIFNNIWDFIWDFTYFTNFLHN